TGPSCDRKLLRSSNNLSPGLRAEYYAYDSGDTYFFKRKVLSRTDLNIDFPYGNSGPQNAAGVPRDRFAVRWSGYLIPPKSGRYTLCTCTDDGVRLSVDGQMLINRWVSQGSRFWWTEIDLEQGKEYPFRMEYYDQ